MNAVRTMQPTINERQQWALFHGMSRMLRRAGDVGASEQSPGWRNAIGNRSPHRESWPGERVGVRAPEAGEIPLSAAEVGYLFRGQQ
jgi:hypothetical protein